MLFTETFQYEVYERFAQTFLQRVPKTAERPLGERTRFSFLLCQKDKAARFCPSFGIEPYIKLTLFT
ncbi:hypothetical protein LBK30_05425 [Leptospira borgpetersenii serovar Hardjo]|nr:hypothetical protein LBK30_05425 [Leptospira borgpetersenii serovar Hardjo]